MKIMEFIKEGSQEEKELQIEYYIDRLAKNEKSIKFSKQKIKDCQKDILECKEVLKELNQ